MRQSKITILQTVEGQRGPHQNTSRIPDRREVKRGPEQAQITADRSWNNRGPTMVLKKALMRAIHKNEVRQVVTRSIADSNVGHSHQGSISTQNHKGLQGFEIIPFQGVRLVGILLNG